MSTNENFVSDAPAQFSFPLLLRQRDRVRGDKKNQAPSPLSSPVKGEEVFWRRHGIFNFASVRE